MLNLWTIKAYLYNKFRNRFPFKNILVKENSSVTYLLKKIPLQSGTVVDLGTGTGNILQLIDAEVVKVGIDSNYPMLRFAANNLTVNFINCDITKLSIKDQSAELVTAIGVLEYFSEYDSILSEISRITKHEARVIISFSPKNVWFYLRSLLGCRIHSIKYDDFLNLLKKHGFYCVVHNKLMMQHQLLIKKLDHGTSSF